MGGGVGDRFQVSAARATSSTRRSTKQGRVPRPTGPSSFRKPSGVEC